MRGLSRLGVDNLLLAPTGPLLEKARTAGFLAEEWPVRGEWDLGAMFAATSRMRTMGAAVAHCHSAHAHALGVPAARMAGVPAVVVSRRVDFAVATNPFSALKYRLPVDRYFCISRGVMEAMRRGGVSEERLALVPSGIEFPDPPPGPSLRDELGLGGDTPIVGTVAALAPHKDHATLLAAVPAVLESVPEAHFVWLGEGECRPALERQRASLGLASRVHMLGFRRDAHALLRQFTVFALSSHLEGLCTSLLDAQALGIPIVATAVGGIPDVITDGVTGRLVPARDPSRFAAAVAESLRDPLLRARWSAAARQSVRSFHIDRTVERSLEEYRKVLDGKRRAA
jgi:glycosyltransferase involved in cell wall biosynthesis